MMRSESSNYKLGRLDKVIVLKFVLTRTNQPRYRVQDGSWPNHKNKLSDDIKKNPPTSTRKDTTFLVESLTLTLT